MGTHRADLCTNNFDFLRFLFASLVILSHSYEVSPESEPLARATGGVLYIGTIAVFAFFAISGFLVTASWSRSSGVADYFLKRLLRIYPGFVVAILLSCFLVAPMAGCPWKDLIAPAAVARFARDSIFFQPLALPWAFTTLPVPHDINSSVWSIKYEFLCYVILALVGVAGLLPNKRFAAGAFLGLIFFYVVAKLYGLFPVFQGTYLQLLLGQPITLEHHCIFFFAGIVAYEYRDRLRFSGLGAIVALAALIVSCLIPASLSFVVPIAFTYLIFWFAFEPRLKLSRFGRFGDFSYGIYLYAFPIQQLLLLHIGVEHSPWTVFFITWMLSILAGAISWHVVERPFLKRKPHPVAAATALHAAMPT
jgi:peptidoglycan/LPS O-acetylase OafA/YrhL